MAGSAIATQTAQALAQNIYNADKTTPIYNGGWDFKNASGTTTFAVSATGAMTAGPDTATPNTALCNLTNGNISSRAVASATDLNGGWGIAANAYRSGAAQPTRLTGIGGVSVRMFPRTADTDLCLLFSTNLAANSSTTAEVNVGSLTQAGAWSNVAGGSWGTISDERLKKNIISLSSCLSTIMALRPVSYAWRDDNVNAIRPTEHFIAQEVELVNSKWVTDGGTEKITEDGVEVEIENCKQVNLDASFNAYLVKAIQEQQAMIEELKAKVAALEAK